MKKKEGATYFVSIHEPDTVRRDILEASKAMLQGLAQYEKFKAARQEKLEAIRKLRLDLRKTSLLILRLKSILPQMEEAPEKKATVPAQRKVSANRREPRKTALAKKGSTELDRLEAELDDIEDKLGSIS